jgi:hypothetical protein
MNTANETDRQAAHLTDWSSVIHYPELSSLKWVVTEVLKVSKCKVEVFALHTCYNIKWNLICIYKFILHNVSSPEIRACCVK